MSGNVLIICFTVIICAVLLAFCHYQEHKCDISDDRYQYLCERIEDLRKEIKSLNLWVDQLQDNMQKTDSDIAAGFEKYDRKILNHEKRLQILANEVFSEDELNSAFDAVLSGNCSP